jgi:hypothetical protein
MQLEDGGIPTVTVVSEVFATLGAAVATRLGMPELPRVIVPHPVAHRSRDELEQVADATFDGVVRALTTGNAHA